LSERSPLPPALSAKDHPGGESQIFNVHRIRIISGHLVESDEDTVHENISDNHDWLNWNGDLDHPNASEDDTTGDVESDIVQDNPIKEPQCPEQQDTNATPNVPGLIRPNRKSKRQAEMVLVTLNALETRRNKKVKIK
jgi:hypothetical protein